MNKKPKASPKTTGLTDVQQHNRAIALQSAATLISNPVHAFAANPQNVMSLADIFTAFIEGRDLPVNNLNPAPQPVELVRDTAPAPTPMAYA